MGGFNDWVEKIADSKNALDYRKKVSGAESVSMWQSLSFGANYKALIACPSAPPVRKSSHRFSLIARNP